MNELTLTERTILDILKSKRGEVVTESYVAIKSKYGSPTVHKSLKTLEDKGLISQEPSFIFNEES